MKFVYDILPTFLFFLVFKYAGIYTATLIGMIATLIQVLINRIGYQKWDMMQLITFTIFVLFGSMTLYFHDPIFVKWKPTILFWVFALCLLISQFFAKEPIIERFMRAVALNGAIPKSVWLKLNMVWALFLLMLGCINLYIAYYFDNNTWVNFKFYGVTSAIFVFSFLQSIYLARYFSK